MRKLIRTFVGIGLVGLMMSSPALLVAQGKGHGKKGGFAGKHGGGKRGGGKGAPTKKGGGGR